MRRVSRELRRSARDRYTVTEAAARVKQNEVFIVEAATCVQPVLKSPEDCRNFIERQETGPIYVEGIKAGDMMRIDIIDIKIVGHASGARCKDNGQREFFEVKHEEGIVICHGGLLYLGDLHAYQGWGEWLGVGCECAGDVTISVCREDFFVSQRPVIIKKDSYTCIACRVSYGEAIDLALNDAALILVKMTGLSHEDALSYCKLTGNGMNGQMWHLPYPALYLKDGSPVMDFPCTVGMEIPTGILKKYGKIL